MISVVKENMRTLTHIQNRIKQVEARKVKSQETAR